VGTRDNDYLYNEAIDLYKSGRPYPDSNVVMDLARYLGESSGVDRTTVFIDATIDNDGKLAVAVAVPSRRPSGSTDVEISSQSR